MNSLATLTLTPDVTVAESDSLSEGFAHLLSRLTTGVIFLDAATNCVFASARAQTLLNKNIGLWVHRGHLRSRSPENERLQAAVIAATQRSSHSVSLLTVRDADEMPAILVAVCPFTGVIADKPIQASVVLRATNPRVHDAEQRLQQLFDFSVAEASLAWTLFEVGDLADACGVLGKSIATGRSQLRSVLAKTKCRRQSELFRLICAATSIISYEP